MQGTNISSPNMNSLVHVCIFILVSLISYDQLAKLPSVEASRKLNPENGCLSSFMVELIHRDSPHSPYYNSSSMIHHHLGSVSSSIYYNNKESFSPEVIPNGGDYLMRIGIGTPPAEFWAVADTGSDLVWVQCSPCQRCVARKSPLFDPSTSTTLQTVPCDSQTCQDPLLQGTCDDNGQCGYGQHYGFGNLGSETHGILLTDTFTLGTSSDAATFPTSIFGCGVDQEGHFVGQSDGIVGLGTGSLSLISQLGSNINYKFSYCLTPLFSGVNSKLKFGDDVTSPNVVSTTFSTQHTHYTLTLGGITVGDTSIPVNLNIIIDSGTTLTYLDSSVYDSVMNTIQSAIELSPVSTQPMLCYQADMSGGSFNPPDVVFNFEGADVRLKAINTFVQIHDLVCLVMNPADGISIFGNIAQVNFEVGYDLQAQQVSFATADCASY